MDIKPVQIRMARAALSWGVRDLADKAGITANTVTRIENGSDAKQSTINAIRGALESAGVEFIAENGGGAGVRLRKGSPRGDPSASIKVEDLTAENDE
ncbi:helix-turn-helix transcriptional regulator [Methylocapsa sp. D3K7]|uniref:helix-turn-helix domain-containing protein n=1 Tax=Methylocapsa sp. D3K7 TaxID=3041435 RepID=UPI0032992DA9